jgi:hypothetical protein
MTSGEVPPEREEQIMVELLRERGGIEPGMLGPVLDLAVIGLVNGTWRNTCVETWHVQGRMRDGDMLRVNAHTTWRARQLVRRWARDIGLEAAGPTSALDGATVDAVWWLTRRLHQWLVNPSRELPTGVTLGQLAGDEAMTCPSTRRTPTTASARSASRLRTRGAVRLRAYCGARRAGMLALVGTPALACPGRSVHACTR